MSTPGVERTVRLYCYDTEPTGDPHAIQIELSQADITRVGETRERENVGRWDTGVYVTVTDQQTGTEYEVASAPCGERCHCACVARRVR